MKRYRIIQDGMSVAEVEGPTADTEIMHYAIQYAQDGPIEIQEYVNQAWRKVGPVESKEDAA